MEDILKVIENYRAPDDAIKLVKGMKIALLAGITGAGKNAVGSKLLESGDYSDIITTISRPMRPNEENGVDYYFIDGETALENLLNQKYFEVKNVHGRAYGTTIAELKRISTQNKIALADVDVQGVDEYYTVIGNKLPAIFLVPPDYQTWQNRLLGRDKLSDNELTKRTQSAIMEIEHVLSRDYYHFVINDDLDKTANLVDQIIKGKISNYDSSSARETTKSLLDDIILYQKTAE